MPESESITFRADRDLRAALDARARDRSPQLVARRDLARWYAFLAERLARVRLTRAEAHLLLDLTNGTLFEPFTALLWIEVADAEDTYFTRWGVDRAALVGTLRALDVGAVLAIQDALERFWVVPRADVDAGLLAVGLLRED